MSWKAFFRLLKSLTSSFRTGHFACSAQDCLVLSIGMGECVMGTTIGDYIGATIRIHSPIPY